MWGWELVNVISWLVAFCVCVCVKHQARLPAESEDGGRGFGYFRRREKIRYGEFLVMTQDLSLKVPLSGFHSYLYRYFPNIWRGLSCTSWIICSQWLRKQKTKTKLIQQLCQASTLWKYFWSYAVFFGILGCQYPSYNEMFRIKANAIGVFWLHKWLDTLLD